MAFWHPGRTLLSGQPGGGVQLAATGVGGVQPQPPQPRSCYVAA